MITKHPLTPGSLTDKTVRLPMDNAVFVKLQNIIEVQSHSPLW